MKRKGDVKTAREAVEKYLAEKRANGLSECTLRDYEYTLNMYIEGVEMADELDEDYFHSYTSKMLESKKPVTVNHWLRNYGCFSNWLMEQGIIEHFKVRAVKEQEPPLKIYTEEEIEKLLKKPTKKDSFNIWRSWAVVSFVMATGARAGTIIEMKVSDVNLKEQEVIYRHSKNKKAVVIPICDKLKKVLIDYMSEFELGEYLFPGDNNTKTTTNGLRHGFERFCKKRGVVPHSFHGLRHTYAKMFIVAGGNALQLQKMLNHSTLKMTQHYAHIFGEDLHNAVNDFSPLSRMGENERIKRKG